MDNANERIYQIARSQVDFVKTALKKRFDFKDDNEDKNDNNTENGYTTYGTLKTPTAIIVLRISNHICSMDNWTARYKQKLVANNKLLRRMGHNIQDPYKDRCFYSIVFKAFDYQPNDVGSWKASCSEYVFNPLEIEKNRTIGEIVKDCVTLNQEKNVKINGVSPIIRVAKTSKINNHGNITDNKIMNKMLIRLTESDLHRIVKESVNNILTEGNGRVIDELEEAYSILKGITKSGFIPFTSSSPSSTENELKMAIVEAMRMIDKSKHLYTQLYGTEPMAHIC